LFDFTLLYWLRRGPIAAQASGPQHCRSVGQVKAKTIKLVFHGGVSLRTLSGETAHLWYQ
jgi:hypothetical protein